MEYQYLGGGERKMKQDIKLEAFTESRKKNKYKNCKAMYQIFRQKFKSVSENVLLSFMSTRKV